MSNLQVENSQLSDLIEFDRQLRELVAAGVSLERTDKTGARDLVSQSDSVAGRVAVEIARGSSFWEAFQRNSSSPHTSYALAFASWFATDRSPKAFDLLQDVRSLFPVARAGWLWRLQLAIVLTFALLTLVIWSLTGGFGLQMLNQDWGVRPGPVGELMLSVVARFQSFTASLPPYLSPLVLGGVIASPLLFYWFFARSEKRKGANESCETLEKFRKNQFLRVLTSHGYSLEDAKGIYGEVVRGGEVRGPGVSPGMAFAASGETPEPRIATSGGMPGPRGDARAAALGVFLNSSLGDRRRLQRRFSTFPYAFYLGVGGCVVLLVGLSVFAPIMELVHTLSDKGPTFPYVLYLGASGVIVLLVGLSIFVPIVKYLYARSKKGVL